LRKYCKEYRRCPVREAKGILLRPQAQNMNTIYYTVVVQFRMLYAIYKLTYIVSQQFLIIIQINKVQKTKKI